LAKSVGLKGFVSQRAETVAKGMWEGHGFSRATEGLEDSGL